MAFVFWRPRNRTSWVRAQSEDQPNLAANRADRISDGVQTRRVVVKRVKPVGCKANTEAIAPSYVSPAAGRNDPLVAPPQHAAAIVRISRVLVPVQPTHENLSKDK